MSKSKINRWTAWLAVILLLSLGAACTLAIIGELTKVKSIFEAVYWLGILYTVGIFPILGSLLLLKNIFISKGKVIVLKDSPKLYYFLVVPVFLVLLLFVLFFLITLVRQFMREGWPNSISEIAGWFVLILILFGLSRFIFLGMLLIFQKLQQKNLE